MTWAEFISYPLPPFFFFPLKFFHENMGPWDFFESFLNKQNIFIIKLCIPVHEVVLKVRTMIF